MELCSFTGNFVSNKSPIPITNTINIVIQIICLAMVPAICEELIFRDILKVMYFKENPRTIAILTSLMFAFLHMSVQQFLYTFISGIFLFFICYITENLFFSILMHFEFNCISIIIVYFDISILKQGILTYFLITLCCIPVIYILISNIKSINKKSLKLLSSKYNIKIFFKYINTNFLLSILICSVNIVIPILFILKIVTKTNLFMFIIFISICGFILIVFSLFNLIKFLIGKDK
ncbi:hypothetical protein UT300003_26190 [Clostridium sardiniense]